MHSICMCLRSAHSHILTYVPIVRLCTVNTRVCVCVCVCVANVYVVNDCKWLTCVHNIDHGSR